MLSLPPKIQFDRVNIITYILDSHSIIQKMQPMSLYQAFFNVDAQVQLAYGDVVCIKGAGVVALWNIDSGVKKYLHSEKHGFQCCTANHRTENILVAEYSKNPKIHVYLKDTKLFTLSDGIGTLQINKMVLSNDGRYLIIVNGIPEYSISVIDMSTKQKLKGKNSSIPLQTQENTILKDIVINPADSTQFAVLYNNEVSFFRIDIDYQANGDEVVQNYRIIKLKSLDGKGFQNILYDSKGNLYVATQQRLYYINRETFHLNIFYQGSEKGLRSVILTQRHLIVFYQSGLIQWINRFQEDMIQDKDETLRPFYKCYNANINPHVKSAIYNHTLNKLIVGHQNGLFSVILSEAQRGIKEREEDDHNLKEQDAEEQNNQEFPKILNLQVQLQGPYHTKAITFIAELSSSPIAISAGKDGAIIFWNLQKKSVISHQSFQEEFVSGHINGNQNLIALGTSRGVLMVFSVLQDHKINLIYQANIIPNTSLDYIKFNSQSTLIAVASYNSKSIFFAHIPVKGKCHIVGYVQTPFEISAIAWSITDKQLANSSSLLFVLMNSLIGGIVPPSAATIGSINRGDALRLDLEFYARKIDSDQKIMDVLPSGEILVSGKDKILRKYKQPEEFIGKIDLKSRTAPNPPLQQIDGHALPSTCISVSKKNNLVATGAEDGTVIVRNGNALDSGLIDVRSQNLRDGGVSSILISNISKLILCGGYDGSLLIWTSEHINFKLYSKKQKQQLALKTIQSKGDKLEHFQVIQEKDYLKSIQAEVIQKKKTQMDKLNVLKNELKQLLQQNQKHEEVERLPRDQFAIDILLRQKILNQGKEICEAMRQDSRKLNLKNQILSLKLKEKTWDHMEVQLKGVNGLRANILVYNYQIRKRSQKQIRTIKLVLDLRRNAVKELKDRKTKGNQYIIDIDLLKNKNVVNGGCPTVLVLTDYEKQQQKKQQKMKKKKDQEQQKPKKEQAPQTDQQWSLLYSAFELFSDNAKKNQIIMIKNLIFKIKQIFNKEFDGILHQRQATVDMINDRNKRIIQIYQQLKRDVDVSRCNQNILQNPDRILSVDPKQVGFDRYLSREERQRLQKERLREEERLRLLAQDDASQRALTKMMNGTLEQKKESALQIVIQRQKWMDKPLEEMNEDQKMKLKQYQVRKSKAEEEKQRTIKKLQAEIRKLKLQIEDLLEKFDEKLLVVFKRKLEYDYRIEEQELYVQKLLLSMLSYVEGQQKLRSLQISQKQQQEDAAYLQSYLTTLKDFSNDISKNKQAKRQALEARRGNQLQIRIKNVQKNVFEQFNNSNPKQKRKLRDKWIQIEPALANKIIRLDPYLAIESNSLWESKSKQFSTFLESIKTIQQNYQGNQQTLLNALEVRFNLRKDEADLDKKLVNINNYIVSLEKKCENLRDKCHQTQKNIQETKSFLATSKSNIEVQLRLKQGNVQLQIQNDQKVVPQLSQAILLPRQAIESKNQSILQSAGEKIQVMKKIKTCKISVTEQELNLKNKEQLAQQLYNKIKSIQMLKVKKEMQTALVKKDIKMNQNEIKSIQQQIDNLHRQAQKRTSVFQKKIQKIDSDIYSIMKENDQLQVQRQSLEETVKQRLKIQQMMNNQGSSGNESRQKFEQISIIRRLFDNAKRQTQTIQLLRQQLAKLKAKTFANFSNIQR